MIRLFVANEKCPRHRMNKEVTFRAMRTIKRQFASLAFLLCTGLLPAYAQSNWAVKRLIHVGGTGGWDYLTVDPATHRLYVPRSTHTMVIEADSGNVIADIPG